MKSGTSMTVHSLAELKHIKKAIAAHAAHVKQEAEKRQQQQRRAAQQSNLFLAAIGKVQPLHTAPRAHLAATPPEPLPFQLARDEAAALQESMSDEIDIANLLDTDDGLSFRRDGVGIDVTQKLRRGQWAVQQQVDLHGLRTEQAREVLGQFIRDMHKQGVRCVRVIHGKGLGSPGKTPVLKNKVQRWLVQREEILAFVQAQPNQGGAGALLVLLQGSKNKV
jgi:DNA-nicking Smr family endonuclease